MCGIAGIIEPNADNDAIMAKMLEVLRHRGPDAHSTFKDRDVLLGHRRLSIIDLKTGDQPIYTDDRQMCIMYNGEIYNYRELRDELKQTGSTFCTASDTEVILKGYQVYGADIFARLNGIFAFAIYDRRDGSLVLARDHFGIKPMHYYWKDGLFIFASEQKAIIQHPGVERALNYRALHLHLNLRYTQGEETLFEGIKRLPPAHYLRWKAGEVEIKPYWQLEPEINHSMTEGEAIEGIHFYLKQAVRRQLISDVPIGVYLSGGMDSSSIVQKMHELGVGEINTFTLGFNEPTDENDDARIVARLYDTRHREMKLPLNPLERMSEVIWHAEEPKTNLLQGYNISKFVGPHVKVVLAGLGGDELFAGYDIHRYIYPTNGLHTRVPGWLKRLWKYKSDLIFRIQHASGTLKWDEYRRGIQMLLSIGDIEKYYLILRNVWDFDDGLYQTIYSREFLDRVGSALPDVYQSFKPYFDKVDSFSPFDRVLYTEFHSKMVNDYLLVEDRMSMAHSVEERVPFLDLDLVRFGFSIPLELKIKHNRTKYLFRKAMSEVLPDAIIRKRKWGFAFNPYLQFRKDLKEKCEQVLTREFIEKQGIFNYDYIRQILDAKPHPRMRWHYNFLWILLGLAVWEDVFLNGRGKSGENL